MLEADAQTTLTFASALSTAANSDAAVDEVLSAMNDRMTAPVDLVVVFATMHHAANLKRLCRRLSEAFETRTLLACTCAGVIGVQREVETGPGLSVLVGSLPGATLHPFSYEQIDLPSVMDAPASLLETIGREDGPILNPRALLLLADPFSTPMIRLLPTLNAAFPGTPVIGGLASGGRRAAHNRLMLGDTLLRDGAVGLVIAGDVDVQTTVSQGCRPVGKPFIITRAKRHVVQELGGRNALEAVRDMAQQLDVDEQRLLQSNGIFVGRVINEYKHRFGRGDFLVRNLIGVDPDEGYLAINDPQVRVGQTVQFHVRDQQTATDDLTLLLEAQKIHGPADGALLFSCNSRGGNLFDRPNADAAMVADALGAVPLAGFFAAGEIGPVADHNFVHGHTASLVVFRSPQLHEAPE